jgi:hypothetical protein
MKFVFLKSGDYLEFQPKKTKFVKGFFDYLFSNGINDNYGGDTFDYILNDSEKKIEDLNQYITSVNNSIKILVPENEIVFDHGTSLNQDWLNDTHKKWAYLTHTYKDNIYDVPHEFKKMWNGVNDTIHKLEMYYSHRFENTVITKIPESANLKVEQEDAIFSNSGLCLSYSNLGRHQYNQWEVGSEIDHETNNYEVITTTIVYKFGLSEDVANHPTIAPEGYAKWCKERNIPVLGPWVSLGDFALSRFDVREIMHKNLKKDVSIGFEI